MIINISCQQLPINSLIVMLLLNIVVIHTEIIAQPNCNLSRYNDDIFSVHVNQEPAVYATAPDIPSVYLGEGVTFPQDLSFDFYEPIGDTIQRRPLIIMAFGGAFLGGDKRQPELVAYCEAMTRKGFCVASIDYRINFNLLSTSSSIRAVYRGLQDFRAAVRYFRHNSSTYKIDPQLIIGGGNSAGSINAIHAAYIDESDRTMVSIFAATFASPNTPDLGCIDCSGNSLLESGIPNLVVNLWGGMGDISWIEMGESSIISFHGLDDTTVSPNTAAPFGFPIFPPLSGSIPIHARTNDLSIKNELLTYPEEGHELWNDNGLADEIVQESSDFLFQYLRPQQPVLHGNTIVCSDSMYTYLIEDSNPSSQYCWDVVNGTILSTSNDSLTIQWSSSASTGSIQIIELNSLDAQSEPFSIDIIIDPISDANFNFSFTGPTTNFENTSIGAIAHFWEFDDGSTSTLVTPNHTFQENGTYNVQLTITGPCGGMVTHSILVTQNCQPDLNIQADPTVSGIYQAYNSVTSNKPLSQDAEVFFKAQDLVDLQSGFEVNIGDDFEVDIETCIND